MAQPEKSNSKSGADEHFLEIVIGNLLRACVIATVAVVLFGAVIFLPSAFANRPSFGKFNGEPEMLRSVTAILASAWTGDGKAIIQAGMLLLILTPVLRVAFSVVAFLYEKDYLYVAMTLLVLGLLIFSLTGG